MVGMISQFSHLVAALAFLILGLAIGLRRAPSFVRLSIALAAFVTAFWAGGEALAVRHGPGSVPFLSKMETLRTASWIFVLLLMQRRSLGLVEKPGSSFVVAMGLGFVITWQLLLDALFSMSPVAGPLSAQPFGAMLFIASRLVVAISGLVLLHNLYVNTSQGGFRFRLFVVGLAVLFAYDLNLYTIHFLVGVPNQSLLGMRGAVDALAVPLLYLGMRETAGARLHLSRQAAFHSVSFSIIGAYLILMSLLAYGLRLTGGSWGQLLQVVFMAITLIAGALVLLSPRFRAELRVRISRNFYRYRYDYRVEWLRFIDMIDAAPGNGVGRIPFRERLAEAVATVMHCPGAALLEASPGGGFELTARWCWPQLDAPRIPEGSALGHFVAETGRIVDFDKLRAEAAGEASPGSHADLTLPAWAAADRAIWLAVPLIHRERLTGILLLERTLVPRDLNWEDFDLLRTLGRQGASYLAETETQSQLEEAKRFEEFNRRFAFVMHDLKNVVSQLGLVARNAERHADKPEFRADMIATLNSSVAKMTDLLKLMGREAQDRERQGRDSPARDGERGPHATQGTADIAMITSMVVVALRRQHPAVELAGADAAMPIVGDAQQLEAMLTHLVQNAIDASAPDAPVRLVLSETGPEVRITVADSGHGMSAGFIRDELFRPFRSTKDGGFGIGAYEAREIARQHGGRLDVESRPGEGTCFTVTLPRGAAATDRKSGVQVSGNA